MKAIKHDANKPPLSLIPIAGLIEVARVLDFGRRKYDTHNWRKGFHWSRLLDASLRHITSFIDGEDKDKETGLSHLAHATCCLMFLLEFQAKEGGSDDRYKAPSNNSRAAVRKRILKKRKK